MYACIHVVYADAVTSCYISYCAKLVFHRYLYIDCYR